MKGLKFFVLIVALALVLSSCGVNKNDDAMGGDLTPVSSLNIDEEEAATLNEKLPIILYFGDAEQNKLVKEIQYVDIAEAKKGAETLATAIIKQLVKGPKSEKLTSLIAEGTTLRSPVTINDRIATVDFTKEFVDNHPGGKEKAELTIFSVVNSLTEMKEIERVRININGKETKNFKDNVQLNKDFPRNEAIVNKEVGLSIPFEGEIDPVVGPEEDEIIEISGEEDPLE